MYSHTSYSSPFDLAGSAQLSQSEIEVDSSLSNYEHHNNVDYDRRPSYFTGLLSSSEPNLSDQEQQIPSPFSVYEDYQYHHPLDNSDKRRMSTLVELPQLDYQTPDNIYSTAINPWLAAHAESIANAQSNSPLIYANPSIDMYSPQYFGNNFYPLCPPANDSLDLYMDGTYRERASSSCSSSSTGSKISVNVPSTRNNNKTATEKVIKRSRGRRVSNTPSASGQKFFTCTFGGCGKVFKRSEHLKRHIISIHSKKKPFSCPYKTCCKQFSRTDNLNQHIRIHRHTGKDKNNNTSSTHQNTFNNFMPAY